MKKTKPRDFQDKNLAVEARKRREWLEVELKIDLDGLAGEVEQIWAGRNIENVVGTVQVPVGVVGPVTFQHLDKKVTKFIPLATTEGALVASVARGCKAISTSKAQAVVEDLGITRAPVFRTQSLLQSHQVAQWLEKNVDALKQYLAKNSSSKHTQLLSLKTFIEGRNLFVRLSFTTGEAMGMNMATIASEVLAKYICEHHKIEFIATSGNMCADKKVTAVNQIMGRGKQIWVEVEIDRPTINQVLKTTPEAIYQVWQDKTVKGSRIAGAISQNAQAANIVAAFYLATGQDLAHVVEASQANLFIEQPNDGLVFSLQMMDVPLGIVGGGTKGASVQAALKILGLDQIRVGAAKELAAALGVVVMAGEISLHAALASQDLAKAHQCLARGGGR